MRRRKPPIPGSIRKRLPHASRYTAVELADGRWLAAGTGDLLVLTADDVDGLPWVGFQAADWDGQSRTLRLHAVDEDDSVSFVTAGDEVFAFTTAVRERIEASIVHVQTRELPGGLVQVLVRRPEHGGLFSQTIVTGLDAVADQFAAEIGQVEAAARTAAGLEA